MIFHDATLAEMSKSVDDLKTSIEVDLAFHRAIAAATHNELFGVLHDSIGEMLVEVRRRNLSRGREERRLVVKMHRRIHDAIAAHDAAAAQQAMRDHLGQVKATWGDAVSG